MFEYDEIMKFRPRNLKMIYHGLDLKKFVYNSYEKREKILFTLTNLKNNNVSRKCIREIIDAFIIIKKRYPEYKLYIAGDIEDDGYPDVYKKVIELNLIGNVIFMGRISDKEKIEMYQKCKMYVQPSFFEGFGLAIAEGMACGAPIVTSRRSAIPEVVGEFASFAEPDDIPGIANAIFKIIENDKYSEKLSLHGRERIEELYSLERRKADIKKILDEIFVPKL
jgi:glycosyltransferase involved in cell wall biosynthesis